MSQSRRNSKDQKIQIDLDQIVHFLHFISVMTGALLLISILFFLITSNTAESTVVYSMTIAVNAIAFVGSMIGVHVFQEKEEQTEETKHSS